MADEEMPLLAPNEDDFASGLTCGLAWNRVRRARDDDSQLGTSILSDQWSQFNHIHSNKVFIGSVSTPSCFDAPRPGERQLVASPPLSPIKHTANVDVDFTPDDDTFEFDRSLLTCPAWRQASRDESDLESGIHSDWCASGAESPQLTPPLSYLDSGIVDDWSTPSQSEPISVDVVQQKCEISRKVNDFFNETTSSRNRLIGRLVGTEHVDILGLLNDRHIYHVLRLIFSFLSPAELSSASRVCSKWNTILAGEERLLTLIRDFQTQLEFDRFQNKENLGGMLNHPKFIPRQPFINCESILNVETLLSTARTPSIFDRFVQVGQSLRQGEKVRACPRCKHPSIYAEPEGKGKCSNGACCFHFCVRCSQAFHGSRPCFSCSPTKRSASNRLVGDKKSRRVLRRLL